MAKNMPKALGARRALTYLVPIALIVFVIDQLTKVWAEAALTIGAEPIPVIGELIQWRLIYNPGAALSFGTSITWLLTLVSAAVVVGVVWIAPKLTTRVWVLTSALLLGGTLGNLADRLFRSPGFPEGHVVDFIDYGPFVGNVADISIVAAAILIGILSLFGSSPVAEKDQHATATNGSEDEPTTPLEDSGAVGIGSPSGSIDRSSSASDDSLSDQELPNVAESKEN